MTPGPRLTCRGLDLGTFHVPPFEVHAGEAVTLQLPDWSPVAEAVSACLTGEAGRPEVELHGRCVWARPAQPPAGWRRWLSDPRPADWLTARGLSREEAAAALARHRIDNRYRLGRLAGTPRALLGLEAAYLQDPDVLLFDAAGLDPQGQQAVQALVRSRLDRTAAVFLSGPVWSNGAPSYREVPGSAVVEVIARPPVPV